MADLTAKATQTLCKLSCVENVLHQIWNLKSMKRSSQCESLSVSSYSTWKIDILYRAVIRNNKILRKKHQRENIFFISSQINQKRPRFDNVNKVYFASGKTLNWMNKSILSLHSNLLKIVWIEIKSKSKIVWNLIRPKLRQKVPFPPFYCLQLTVIQWGVCTFSHKLYCKVFHYQMNGDVIIS